MATQLVQRNSNVSDETIKRHMGSCGEARDAHAETGSVLSRAYKAAQTDGCNLRELKAALAAQKHDHDKVRMGLRDYVRYLSLVNMPMKQDDLFTAEDPAAEPIVSAADGPWVHQAGEPPNGADELGNARKGRRRRAADTERAPALLS